MNVFSGGRPDARQPVTRRVVVCTMLGVWTFAFVLTFTTYTFFNDHFGRLSPARQIARYGELPFRDFFDPGFVLAELASAAVQRLFGDNLLGEMLLTSAFIATGTLCIFLLVRRLTQSVVVAVVASVVAVMTSPRPYDYDKFLFYPVGLFVCWRYAETGRTRDLVVAAAVAAVAGMFRYDNGVFIAISGLTVIAVTHLRERSVLVRRAGVFLAACAACAVPYLLFLHVTGGVPAAIDQMVTYGLREGAHTRLVAPPSVFAGVSGFSWSAAGAAAAIFYFFLVLAFAAALTSSRASSTEGERARVWSAAVMTLLIAALVLRQPIAARVGGAIAPAAVLAAWMWWRGAPIRFTRVVIAVIVVATLARATEWRSTVNRFHHNIGRLDEVLADATASPPPASLAGTRSLVGVIDYVRRCTQPTDRIFTTWFVPELYFLSGRAFAGGIAASFGDHWIEEDFQRRTVATLAAERVPLVLFRDGDESFRQQYPIVNGYLRARYQTVGVSAFGEPGGERYVVLTPIDRTTIGTDPVTSMPCFAEPR